MTAPGFDPAFDDLEEVSLWQGQTVRAVVEKLNRRLHAYNLQFVETLNKEQGKVTYVIGHPVGPPR